ncbi:hypothetical protein FRACYDRAFT_247284 [Fragilariopsis cylindrus CCMP1102]|uniref:G-protein coupled receptors family 3 profile domain-containing protein n=1 Tax=Fragilariopsis cylindrus CCMP1102 TaxID=635003 RepID=A0A1E7EWV2_9STRA|nr:hypothetical protein FRACYDRAFT_247284 [Fragilariopsis cylindrus CCMP1102]|eukprot:OEU10319.1 hypothetical protein FRACYDRAFT_247284 [Fragilariopsis cylindrus CCMP1102]
MHHIQMSSSLEYVAPWAYFISIILIVVAIICTVGSWAFVFYYQNKPIVAMGQPTFLYNLCFGALLPPIAQAFGGAVTFFSTGENGIIPVDSKTGIILNVCCNFAVWLIYLGYIVIYTVLLCKIYRIMKVTQQPLRRGLKILPRHVFWPFILIISLTVSLLIAWSTTGSSKYVVAEYLDTNTDTNTTIGFCPSLPTMTSVSPTAEILAALYTLIPIVQLALIILACKIRKINQVLGDSKKILGLVVFQFIINGICTSISLNNGGILVYTINCVIISVSTIGFIILPRMYYVWYEYQHGHLPESVVMIGGGSTTVRGVNQNTGNGAGTGVTPPPRIVRNNDDNNNNNNSSNNNAVNICDGGIDNGNNNNNIEDDGAVVEISS